METLIEIIKREDQSVIIFDFTGELDETNADKSFKNISQQIGDFSNKKILFNLSWLEYLNSKSIGYIAGVFSNLDKNNGEMYISNCNQGVKNVLDDVGLTTIIPTVDEESEAVDALMLSMI